MKGFRRRSIDSHDALWTFVLPLANPVRRLSGSQSSPLPFLLAFLAIGVTGLTTSASVLPRMSGRISEFGTQLLTPTQTSRIGRFLFRWDMPSISAQWNWA